MPRPKRYKIRKTPYSIDDLIDIAGKPDSIELLDITAEESDETDLFQCLIYESEPVYYNWKAKRGRNVRGLANLSEMELRLLQMLGQGMKHSEIGKELSYSPKTIKARSHLIYRKLNARNAAHAVYLVFGQQNVAIKAGAKAKGGFKTQN